REFAVPSNALNRWQNDRMHRLGHMDAHCAALFAPQPAAAPAPPPPLAEESLQGYVMLVSGHFQGFCRDLYTECAQLCAAAVPATMRTTIQAQFAAGLELNQRNPTRENIRDDFERFGFHLDLGAAAPGNPQNLIHLQHLNYWRNHAAHQKATPPPAAVPAVLTLADIQAWRASCDGLAISLDDIMERELTAILGVAPW
ncbi:MAG TPA: hypothetical protein VGG30_11575, partial [Pirellulales bacterium]